MRVKMCRRHAGFNEKLDLSAQFGLDLPAKLPSRIQQPRRQTKRTGKQTISAEQLPRIALARQRPPLRQIQMNTEVERGRRFRETAASFERRQVVARVAGCQIFPL